MKPSVPETGTVVRVEGGRAVIFLKGGHGCKGCGAAKIGLCRAGGSDMFLTADNRLGARPGDVVMVGLSGKVQWLGYFLAYIVPGFSLLAGAIAGHMAEGPLGIPSLDVIAALGFLGAASAWSFRSLRRLDASYVMDVKRVVSDYAFRESIETDEERGFHGLSC